MRPIVTLQRSKTSVTPSTTAALHYRSATLQVGMVDMMVAVVVMVMVESSMTATGCRSVIQHGAPVPPLHQQVFEIYWIFEVMVVPVLIL